MEKKENPKKRKYTKTKQLIANEPVHSEPVPESEYNPTQEDIETSHGFNLREMYHPNSSWSVAKKVEVVSTFVVVGYSKKVSRLTGVPAPTIRDWKNRSCWWPAAYEAAKQAVDDEIEAGYRTVVREGVWQLLDKIKTGEDVEVAVEQFKVPVEYETYCPLQLKKIGGKIRLEPEFKTVRKSLYEKKPIPSKDLNRIVGTITDKMLVIQGKATKITENKEDSKSVLAKLQDKLEQLSKITLQERQVNSIEGQMVAKDGDK